jgi:virginiamycin B lyase
VNEFPVPTPGSQPAGITVGPDGALWFTEENGNKIGRITTGGVITNEFPIPTLNSSPQEITTGPDGALWFTEFGAAPLPKIGRVTTSGAFTEFELPAGSGPDGIAAGPDGALWITMNGTARIGRMTTSGQLTHEFPLLEGFKPGDITPGPDGRMWFTEGEADRIGAISVNAASGTSPSEYTLPPGTDPSGIAASAGALWFTEHALGVRQIGRISALGIPITHFGPTGEGPSGIAFGADGALWFTETGSDRIGRMTTSGSVSSFTIPTPASEPGGIVAGPDGAMWFTEFLGNNIGRIEVGSASAPPASFRPAPLTIGTPRSTSKPKSKCRVPRVRGLTVSRARKKMRRAKCRFRVRGKGKVVSTKPRAGTRTSQRVTLRAKPKRRR